MLGFLISIGSVPDISFMLNVFFRIQYNKRMSSYDIRGHSTSTSQRLAELERVNYLTLKSKLNKDYEDAQTERVENERLNIEPAIPVYQSRDELMQSMTSQRQILKLNLETIMEEDEIKKFIGITFKNPEYAILTNQYWEELEPLLKPLAPVLSSYLYEYLNRFFYTKQKLGEEIDVLVDPQEYGDMNDVNLRTAFMTSQPFSDEQVRIAVREIANRNYNMNFDIYSSARDPELISFYVREKVIAPTTKPSMKEWRAIFDKEIRGFDERVGSYLPYTGFMIQKYKEGSPLVYGQPSPAGVPTPPSTFLPRPIPSSRTAPVPSVGGPPPPPSAPGGAPRGGRPRVHLTTTPAVPTVPLGGLPPPPPPPPPSAPAVRAPRRRTSRVVQPGGQPVVNPTVPPAAGPGAPSVASMLYRPPQPARRPPRPPVSGREAPMTPPRGVPTATMAAPPAPQAQRRPSSKKKLTPGPSEETSFEKEFGPMFPQEAPTTPPRTLKRPPPSISPQQEKKRMKTKLTPAVEQELLRLIQVNDTFESFVTDYQRNEIMSGRPMLPTLRALWMTVPANSRQQVVAQYGREPGLNRQSLFELLKMEEEQQAANQDDGGQEESKGSGMKKSPNFTRFGKYRLSKRGLQKKSST